MKSILIPYIESFPAIVTGVWHSFVYEAVLAERSFGFAGVVTMRTIIMSIAVSLHVRIEMTLDIELFAASFALVRIITGVESRVNIKITCVCEAFLTKSAFKFTANVKFHMHFQSVTGLKLSVANLTMLLVYGRMASNMLAQA